MDDKNIPVEPVLVDVTVEYDKETYIKFCNFATLQSSGRAVIFGMLGLLSLFLFLVIVLGITGKDVTFPLIYCLILILYLALGWCIRPRIRYKKFHEICSAGVRFRFFPSWTEVTNHNDVMIGTSSLRYDAFKTVYENKDCFYLKLKNNQWYIVKKTDMAPDDISILRRLFAEKFGAAFKSLKK